MQLFTKIDWFVDWNGERYYALRKEGLGCSFQAWPRTMSLGAAGADTHHPDSLRVETCKRISDVSESLNKSATRSSMQRLV